MLAYALIGQDLSRPEATAALIGLTILICAAIWLLLQWIAMSPVSHDPWSEEVTAELRCADCPQICHRCLTPHESSLHFCAHCGAMVGIYTCLIPPLYLYPIGDVFRAGAEGTYRRSPWLISGCFLAGIVYACWVPFPVSLLVIFVYWKKTLSNIPSGQTLQSEGS